MYNYTKKQKEELLELIFKRIYQLLMFFKVSVFADSGKLLKVSTTYLILLLLPMSINAQTMLTASGIIKSKDGSVLQGATILQKGGKAATISDKDGKFSIEVSAGSNLVISYIGYESQSASASKGMQIVLEESVSYLGEVEVVVNKGYGQSKRLEISSSIASVKGKDIQNQPAYNLGTLLQGKATGVQVTNTSGGIPKILIRGFTTLNTATDPLIIMDGINLGRANLNLVNINDVESIDILKDGAASAIYGSDASGGVIVITTKKGSAGVVKTDVNLNYGSEFYNDPMMAGADEYVQIQKRRVPGYTTPSYATNTDWWNTVIRPTNVLNGNISMSGGSDKLTAYASLGYYKTQGPYYNGGTERISTRLNLEYKPNSKVSAGVSMYPRIENYTNSGLGDLMPAMRTEPVLPIYVNRPGQNEYSQFSATFIERNVNPVAALAINRHNWNKYTGLIGDIHADISPIKNLTLRTQVGINTGGTSSRSYSPPFNNNAFGARHQNYDILTANPDQTQDNYLYASRAYFNSSNNLDWRVTNTANYNYQINTKQKVNILIGYEARKENGEYMSSARAYIPVEQPGLWNPDNAGTPVLANSPNNFIGAGGSRYNESWISYFGRMNYEFNNKFFVEAALRRDGSSRFPVNNQYGLFPSVSGSWIVTEEPFLKNLKQLSFLKLRAGYGSVGNASFNDPSVGIDLLTDRLVPWQKNYAVIGGVPSTLLMLSRPGNPNLVWETTTDINVALESYWLQNRLYFNFELYNRKSRDILFNDYAGRPDLGINSGSWYNLGNMEVKGMESVIGYRDKTLGGLSYDVSMNLSRNRVYLNQIGTNTAALLAGPQGGYRVGEDLGGNVTKIDQGGGLLGNFYGYQVAGVFQNNNEISEYSKNGVKIQPNAVPGDFKFEDLNGDGVINENDKTIIGNAYPKIEVGLNLKLAYKSFDLQLSGYGRFGHQVFWVAKKWLEMGSLGSNVFAGSLGKAWNGEGSTNSYPRFINDANDVNNNLKSSNSWFIENGDYFRLNNIQLGYSLNKNLTTKLGLKSAKVNLNLQNIVTFTKYKGLNPEIYNSDFGLAAPGFDLSQAPIRKSITMGLSIGF